MAVLRDLPKVEHLDIATVAKREQATSVVLGHGAGGYCTLFKNYCRVRSYRRQRYQNVFAIISHTSVIPRCYGFQWHQ
ncbi:hypothetical protein Agabi119p4_8010 [Agaricus bisporus var. burnettii]|uniref:Uncharacterized protein n=1 Tax=Agaricus bisporus var. burnettii TaxID=192524 RepID=A0A8H7C509_AGABI|nr:hypothetical protein Agabi119p4_8010 [Agaricus bisporus var. burnettii]